VHITEMTITETKIIIIGAGGHGSELYSYILDLTTQGEQVQMLGFVDDHKPAGSWGTTRILGGFSDLKDLVLQYPQRIYHYITAVGNNRLRQQLVQKIKSLEVPNLLPWTLRHPSALVGRDVEIGAGTCLAPGSIITAQVRIGKHCIVNVNTSISHNCTIDDFANINPRVAVCGDVNIGEGCYIGAGATLIDKVSIGQWTVIGAGATVTRHIPLNVTAVGVPARVIKEHPRIP
jgi:acetyltransferase EpsM